MQLVSLILLLLTFQIVCFIRASYVEWIKEMKESISANLFGNCHQKYRQLNFKDLNRNPWDRVKKLNDTVIFSWGLPSRNEVREFRVNNGTFSKGIIHFDNPSIQRKIAKWLSQAGIEKWQLLPEHPGQNILKSMRAIELISNGSIVKFYEDFKNGNRTTYLVKGRRAVIHPFGYVNFGCGYFQGKEGCVTRRDYGLKWYQNCENFLISSNLSWDNLWDSWYNEYSDYSRNNKTESSKFALMVSAKLLRHCSVDNLQPVFYKRVFLATAIWDNNYAHLIMDTISRISRFLPFLRKNTDIKIHIRADTEIGQSVMSANKFREKMFKFLNISEDRLVSGVIMAEKVFIPRPITCSYILFNPFEFRLTGKALLEGVKFDVANRSTHGLNVSIAADDNSNKTKTIIILQRDSQGMNIFKMMRVWRDPVANRVVEAFRSAFPGHRVIKFRSKSTSNPNYCASCEMLEYSKADVLVGMHGAGLTNLIFMPQGSLIVEVTNDLVGTTTPYSGYIGMQCAAMGHHHFQYHYELSGNERFNPQVLANESYKFYEELKSKQFDYTIL